MNFLMLSLRPPVLFIAISVTFFGSTCLLERFRRGVFVMLLPVYLGERVYSEGIVTPDLEVSILCISKLLNVMSLYLLGSGGVGSIYVSLLLGDGEQS